MPRLSQTNIALVIGAALAGFVIWWFFPRPDDVLHLCDRILPQSQKVGVKLAVPKQGAVELDVGGERQTYGGASPEQLATFANCIEQAGREVTIRSGVRLPLEPVGQAANRWHREPGLKLTLMPSDNDEVLNNLRFGPAVGAKATIVRVWCSRDQAGRCVTCDPAEIDAATAEVLVRLASNPPVKKEQMPGSWPRPDSRVKSEPWQLVDAEGRRFLYECQRN